MANIQSISHKKSAVVENGAPKLPTISQLELGELAINFADGYETLSIKNNNDEIVTFTNDLYWKDKELVIAAALNDLEQNKQDVLVYDEVPTENSENPVTSGGIYNYITEIEQGTAAALNDLNGRTLTEDTPTQGSTKLVTSGGLYTYITDIEEVVSEALNDLNDRKQDILDIDNAPTQYSNNPISSNAAFEMSKVTAAALNDLNLRKANTSDVQQMIEDYGLNSLAPVATSGSYNDLTNTPNTTVTQIATTGTQIATVGGVTLYAPDATVTQVVTSGTEIAKVGNTSIYAPDAAVNQILTSGVEIAQVGSTSIYSPDDTIYEINHGTSDTVFTLTPGTMHIWGEVASLDLSLPQDTNTVLDEYLFTFTCPSNTSTILSLPIDVKWIQEPDLQPGKTYQVSIINGLAGYVTDNMESGGDENIIEEIKLNGTALPITDKSVNIVLPSETDPIFSASPAAGITAANITTWNNKVSNVQADWNQTTTTADDYIKNKPTIPDDSELVHKDGEETIYGLKTFNGDFGISTGILVQSNSNSNDYIKISSDDLSTAYMNLGLGFSQIKTANQNLQQALDERNNVLADWNQTTTTAADYIKNKPTIPAAVTESTVAGWGFTKNTGTITGITMNGASKGTSGVIDLGTVLTSHQDISGKADKSAAIGSLSLSLDSTNYKITLSGTKVDGTTFTVADVIDLPLESVVVSGAYDNTTKKVVLTLKDGSTVDFSVADLVSGLQTEITSTNKLSADLIADGTTNKVVTAAEKTAWNNKSNFSGNYNDLSNKPTIPAAPGTLNTNNTTAQTVSASEALSGIINLHKVAKTGSYNDLLNKPTIPTALADLTADATHRLVTDTEKSNWNNKASSDTKNTAGATQATLGSNEKLYLVGAKTQGNNPLTYTDSNVYLTIPNGALHTGGLSANTVSTTTGNFIDINTDNIKLTGSDFSGITYGTSSITLLSVLDSKLTSSDIPTLSKGTTTGSGNAVTDISVNGHKITLTKGSTFLTSYTETDPTVPAAVKAITATDISNWNNKLAALVSGTNIKTINGESILGSGNISSPEEIFIATYETTPYNDILTAYNEGKIIFVKRPTDNEIFPLQRFENNNFYFIGLNRGNNSNVMTLFPTNVWGLSAYNLVETSRTINGKGLYSNVTLNSDDIEYSEGQYQTNYFLDGATLTLALLALDNAASNKVDYSDAVRKSSVDTITGNKTFRNTITTFNNGNDQYGTLTINTSSSTDTYIQMYAESQDFDEEKFKWISYKDGGGNITTLQQVLDDKLSTTGGTISGANKIYFGSSDNSIGANSNGYLMINSTSRIYTSNDLYVGGDISSDNISISGGIITDDTNYRSTTKVWNTNGGMTDLATIYSGSSAPSSSLGNNGDIYIKTS